MTEENFATHPIALKDVPGLTEGKYKQLKKKKG